MAETIRKSPLSVGRSTLHAGMRGAGLSAPTLGHSPHYPSF